MLSDQPSCYSLPGKHHSHSYFTQIFKILASLVSVAEQEPHLVDNPEQRLVNGPRHEKTCLWGFQPGPKVIKLFPCSTQLSTKFVLLINVKMPTIVGILTFIIRPNTTSERLKAINFICRYFSFNEQLKFQAS